MDLSLPSQPLKASAVIVAAGLSSRMGSLKPLLPIDDETFLARLVRIFLSSGIDDIVIVTGYQKDKIEAAMQHLPVRCVENAAYATTDMFTSVRLGLEAISAESEFCLFTTADSPCPSLYTVKLLIEKLGDGKPAAIPRYNFQEGHPIGFNRELIPAILQHRDPPGLRNALGKMHIIISFVETPDSGILEHANTPEEYQLLLEHRRAERVPSSKRCTELWNFFDTSHLVRRHCFKVTEVALAIADQFTAKGLPIDSDLVRAAALLHDLSKGQAHHAEVAADILSDLGYDQVADIVRHHMYLRTDKLQAPYEKYIVYIADKLVQGDSRLDAMEKRFAERMNDPNEAVRQAATIRRNEAFAILQQMEELLGAKI